MLHTPSLLLLALVPAPQVKQLQRADARPIVGRGSVHCPGASFLEESTPKAQNHPDLRLRDVVVLDANEAWAVGRASNGAESISVTMRYEGEDWTLVPSPSPAGVTGRSVNLDAVAAVSADEIYAAGTRKGANSATDNFVIRWNGSEWEDLEAPGQSGFGGLRP